MSLQTGDMIQILRDVSSQNAEVRFEKQSITSLAVLDVQKYVSLDRRIVNLFRLDTNADNVFDITTKTLLFSTNGKSITKWDTKVHILWNSVLLLKNEKSLTFYDSKSKITSLLIYSQCEKNQSITLQDSLRRKISYF